jgi:mono/diheme cytochrome c family protein
MKYIWIIGVSCIVLNFSLSGCGGDGTSSDTTANSEDDILTVYERSCFGCHGAVGEGTTFGYQIQEPVADYATWVIRNGRTGNTEFAGSMPGFDESALSDTVLSGILEYLSAQPRPDSGELLYKRFCGNCHGEMGEGGVVGKGIARDARRDPDEFLETVRDGEGGNDYADREDYMPAWTAAEISDSEIWKIAQYLGAQGEMPSNWSSSSDTPD